MPDIHGENKVVKKKLWDKPAVKAAVGVGAVVGGIAGDMFVACITDAFPQFVEPIHAALAQVLPKKAGIPSFLTSPSIRTIGDTPAERCRSDALCFTLKSSNSVISIYFPLSKVSYE